MGDIGKAKHASDNMLVRGKHAKHARESTSSSSRSNVNVNPSRIRYAAGTFLVSSAIALGLFALQPFDASESLSFEESQTATSVQKDLVIKNARAMQANVEASVQSSSLAQVQMEDESSDQEAATTDSDENVSKTPAEEWDAETESPSDADALSDEVAPIDGASENQEPVEAVPEDNADENAVVDNAEDSNEASTEDADTPSASSDQKPDSEPALKTESDDELIETSTSPSSVIAGKVSSFDPYTIEEDTAFFSSVVENKKPIAHSEAQKLAEQPVNYIANVEPQLQQGVLDSGCEIVSLSMALESMGIKANPVDIAEGYLDFEGGMTDGFVGSPYEGGAGFPAGIAKAANAYLDDIDSDRHAYDLTGNSFDVIEGLVARGYPVLTWTTIDFTAPFFHDVFEGDYQWYGNEHCVLLCGVSDDTVLVCDPLEGLVERDAEQFIEIYEQCGSMAIYIR